MSSLFILHTDKDLVITPYAEWGAAVNTEVNPVSRFDFVKQLGMPDNLQISLSLISNVTSINPR